MQNYNFLQKILHHVVLGNKFIKKTLFDIEKLLFLKKNDNFRSEKHIFITSLPRSGTTILLEFIYKTEQFASLTYSDMPFIMAPNLFSKLVRNKNILPKERMHKDGIQYDLKSSEAFDEVFFQTYDDEDCLENLDNFVSLVLKRYKKNRYLSKNNYNFKRIRLINTIFPNAIILIIYRDPLQQAYSLLKTHIHFCNMQKKEKFVLDYMNFLGHKEFGLNYNARNLPLNYTDPLSANHWLEQWYLFYKDIVENIEKEKNVVLISYDELCKTPDIVEKLIKKIDLNPKNDKNFFKLSLKKFENDYDKTTLVKCLEIYELMKNSSKNINNYN